MAKKTNVTKIAAETADMEITEIYMRKMTFNILGTSPMIMHRFDFKAWQELLLPSKQKNRAEREMTMKHDPYAEFRGALYLSRDERARTAIHIPCGMVKQAIAQAGVDIPGATKAALKRLTNVETMIEDFYGIPLIYCAMVRNGGMTKTPDVRTRPIFREWAFRVTIKFVSDLVTEKEIANLLGAAGHIVGIGDWRPEKGGSNGCFTLVDENDPDFLRITQTQGREAQIEAIEHPQPFDENTSDLLNWFLQETARREKSVTKPGVVDLPVKASRRRGNDAALIAAE